MPLPKEKNKVKDDIGEYSMLVYGASKIGKCLAGDTKLVDPQTMKVVTLKEVINKEYKVFAKNNQDQLVEVGFTNCSINEPEQLYSLYTRNGKKIRATLKHPFLVKKAGSTEPAKWVPLLEVQRGDKVAVVTNYGERFGNLHLFPKELDKLYKDKPLSESVLSLSRHNLVQIIKHFAKINHVDHKSHYVFPYADIFGHLLLRFGIRCTLDRMISEDGSPVKVAIVQEAKDVQLVSDLLADRESKEVPNDNIGYEEVLYVLEDKIERTYDIEIPHLHNFIANDFVVHNSTFASKFPDALFLATERGLNSLEVYNEMVTSWAGFKTNLDEIAAGKHPFKTIVIDTVDNLFRLCSEDVCKKLKVTHESDVPYGKGFGMVNSEFHRALHKLSLLPYGLVLISHSKEKEIDTRTGKVKKIIPTLPDAARNIVLALVDMILYVDMVPVKDKEGKKIIAMKRVFRTKPNALFEAGDRTERLPETFDFSYEQFVQYFKSGKKDISENLDDE